MKFIHKVRVFNNWSSASASHLIMPRSWSLVSKSFTIFLPCKQILKTWFLKYKAFGDYFFLTNWTELSRIYLVAYHFWKTHYSQDVGGQADQYLDLYFVISVDWPFNTVKVIFSCRIGLEQISMSHKLFCYLDKLIFVSSQEILQRKQSQFHRVCFMSMFS